MLERRRRKQAFTHNERRRGLRPEEDSDFTPGLALEGFLTDFSSSATISDISSSTPDFGIGDSGGAGATSDW